MMIGRWHSGHGDPTSMSPDQTDKPSHEEVATPFAPLVDVGALEVEFADFAALVPNPDAHPAGISDLSDVLFGEVIDISDLIPRLQPASGDAVTPGFAAADALPEPGFVDGGDVLAATGHATLTILYDDDILASDGTIL